MFVGSGGASSRRAASSVSACASGCDCSGHGREEGFSHKGKANGFWTRYDGDKRHLPLPVFPTLLGRKYKGGAVSLSRLLSTWSRKSLLKAFLVFVLVAYTLVLAGARVNRWLIYRKNVKFYPMITTYRTTLPCGTHPASSSSSSSSNGDSDDGGGIGGGAELVVNAAAVSLFRTPENACEADKLVGWLRELHATWPWMKEYDHVVLHEEDYLTCKEDLENKSRAWGGKVKCLNVSDIRGAFKFPYDLFTQEGGYTYPKDTRNVGYMHMCRLFSKQLFPHLWDTYDYILRIDDDNMPLTLNGDLFKEMASRKAVYGYPAELQEWHKETAETFGLWLVAKMFSPEEAYAQHMNEVFTRNQTALYDLPRRIFFTNFFITKLSFWRQKHIQQFIDDVDKSGNIYRHRWGDAPIHYVALSLFADSCSVLPLCHVSYKHGSTGHMIENCGLMRVEKHSWDEDIHAECRADARAAAAALPHASLPHAAESASMVNMKEGRSWFRQTNATRCTHPVTQGEFVGPKKGTFKPSDGTCYYHGFSPAERGDCLGGRWSVFSGGQNAFSTFSALVEEILPGALEGRDMSIQYGNAYDIVISMDEDEEGGQVVYFGASSLDYDKVRFDRVWSPAPERGNPHQTKKTPKSRKGNPHGTSAFSDSNKRQYLDFFQGAPTFEGAKAKAYTRVSIIVCHYWQNVMDVLWISGQANQANQAVSFYAQVPSPRVESMCLEDVDYCWNRNQPTAKTNELNLYKAVVEYKAFLNTAKVLCEPGRSTSCFVMSGMPLEKAYNALLWEFYQDTKLDKYDMHYVDLVQLARSAPNEVGPESERYLMSHFLSVWVLEMMFNSVCTNVPDRGSPHTFVFDDKCRGVPALEDDLARCDPILFIYKRNWPNRNAPGITTFKDLKCKTRTPCSFHVT